MQICLQNPRIACSTDHVSTIPLIELKYKFKNRDNMCTIHDSCTHQGLPAIPHKADLICRGNTFNEQQHLEQCSAFHRLNSLDLLLRWPQMKTADLELNVHHRSPLVLVRKVTAGDIDTGGKFATDVVETGIRYWQCTLTLKNLKCP
jgi:hypothetical protein